MKKALKIFGIILASLALIFGIFVIVNQVGEKQMNKYIDTFSAVEVGDSLTPVLEDGEYYFEDRGNQSFTDLFSGEKIQFPAKLKKAKCLLFERS